MQIKKHFEMFIMVKERQDCIRAENSYSSVYRIEEEEECGNLCS